MKPVPVTWMLDKEGEIDISRKGFPMLPDFSSTIHTATGRTLTASVPDLGDLHDKVTFAALMRGYIALSRATSREGVLINRPFSPKLFTQGSQPFPTLLMEALKTNISIEDLADECNRIEQQLATYREPTSSTLLKNTTWDCSKCCQSLSPIKFTGETADADDWYDAYFSEILAPGWLRSCRSCRGIKEIGRITCFLCHTRELEKFAYKKTQHMSLYRLRAPTL